VRDRAEGRSEPVENSEPGELPRRSFRRSGRAPVLTTKRHRRRKWQRSGRSADHKVGRLGPLEYTLLGLITLGIAITIAMAILNPSG
jgi:hypothetical protein